MSGTDIVESQTDRNGRKLNSVCLEQENSKLGGCHLGTFILGRLGCEFADGLRVAACGLQHAGCSMRVAHGGSRVARGGSRVAAFSAVNGRFHCTLPTVLDHVTMRSQTDRFEG